MKAHAPVRFSLWALSALTFIFAFSSIGVLAQTADRLIRIARLSLTEGQVDYQRAQDARDEWFEATANLPLDERDQVFTGEDGRAEIQLTGGNVIRLNRRTNLQISEFNTTHMQFALPVGTATIRIESLDRRRLQIVNANSVDDDQPIYFEISTPTAAVTLLREGNYRINVAEDGTTEVIVRDGAAEVYNKELGAVRIKEGRRIIIEGADPSEYRIARLQDKDWWDQWNERREAELYAIRGAGRTNHVPAFIAGGYDLDYYGDWVQTSDYGWAWSPRGVGADWAPYRYGGWRWYPSFGWTWIANEPWGWAPYHYGRWAFYGNRWCWVPRGSWGSGWNGGWNWSPSLVAFYGRGYREGYRDGYRDGRRDRQGDWIGWVPLGPRDRLTPTGTMIAARPGEELENLRRPGGLNGVESGRFTRSRVIVHEMTPNSPNSPAAPVSTGTVSAADVSPIEIGQFRPSERGETPRIVPAPTVSRGRGGEAGVVQRRVIAREATPGVAPAAGNDPANAPAGEVRAPARRVEIDERPTRVPEQRPVERPAMPTRRVTRDEGRSEPNRTPPAVTAPSRPVQIERRPERTETPRPETRRPETRRPETPRPEAPRPAPPRTEAPRREEPRPQPPPRQIERPAERAPERQPDKPAPAPSRPGRPVN